MPREITYPPKHELGQRRFGDLVQIAQVIQNALIEYQESIPEEEIWLNPEEYKKLEDFVVGKALRFYKGCMNPSRIKELMKYETSVVRKWPVQC